MKRNLLISLLLCLALLTACTSAEPAMTLPSTEAPVTSEQPVPSSEPAPETTAAATEKPTEATEPEPSTEPLPVENEAFVARFPSANDTILAAIYNAPFTIGAPEATVTWNDGEYEQLYILPRYPGSTVRAYQMSFDEEGALSVAEEPTFSTVAENGTVIYASLIRPEGAPLWLLEVETPDGHHSSLELYYNGRYGTPVYEFLEDPYASALIDVPTAMEDWNPQAELIGMDKVWSFWRAAKRQGMDPWDAVQLCFSMLQDVGDGAAYSVTQGGDTDGGVCTLQTARLHEGYDAPDTYDLAERVRHQYDLYQAIGNERMILGPESPDVLPELLFQLTGLTVYNPSLQAEEIAVTVNGEAVGTYMLADGDFCTVLPLSLPEQKADKPITVEVRVVSVRFGTPEETILEVWPGVGGNISAAR